MGVVDLIKKMLIEDDMADNDFLTNDEMKENKEYLLFFYGHVLGLYYDKIDLNINLLDKSLKEDFYRTLQLVFFLRDYKGLRQRKIYSKILKHIAKTKPKELRPYIKLIPYFGRYDDIYMLFDTDLEPDALRMISRRLEKDIMSEKPSNMCKWLKSINTSNKKSRYLAKKTAKGLSLSYKEYRQILSKMRKKLNVVERLMSSNSWEEIRYGELSRKNIQKYHKAFERRDGERFKMFKSINNLEISDNGSVFKSDIYEKEFCYLKPLKKIIVEEEYDIFQRQLTTFFDEFSAYKDQWIPSTALSEVDIEDNNTFFLQAMMVNKFYLYNNVGANKNLIIKTKGTPNLKKVALDFKASLEDSAEYSISDSIDIEALFDSLLLNGIKGGLKREQMPYGIALVVKNQDSIKTNRYNPVKKDSIYDEVKKAYMATEKKWINQNFELPRLKIWIISPNLDGKKISLLDDKVVFIKGTGEKAFNHFIKEKNKIVSGLTYDDLYFELVQILELPRYDLKVLLNCKKK